jgi:hypothetical protein
MSYAPFPSNDGGRMSNSAQSTNLRLADAEKIATNRLDFGGNGSLEEALADVRVQPLPRSPNEELDQLADRIEAAQAGYNPATFSSSLPFLAETSFGFAGHASDDTLQGMREWSDARASVASELAELQGQPQFLHEQARLAEGGTHWLPVGHHAEPYARSVRAEVSHAHAAPAPAIERPTCDVRDTTEAAPIATALDTAAKLASDANAAAVALENLTRLLQNHRPASVTPVPPQSLPERAQEPIPQPRVMPQHIPAAARDNRPSARNTGTAPRPPAVARPAKPPALRPTPVPNDGRQFDVRGFMAGFALSWAIGAVLYIYMMVG